MKRKAQWSVIAAAAAGVGAAAWIASGSGSSYAGARSDRTPPPVAAPEPAQTTSVAPRLTLGPPEYQAAGINDVHPGKTAMLAMTDDFMRAQADEVEAHIAREKITREETRELTNFALTARSSLNWDAVEQITGHPIHPNARKYAEGAMFDASEQMKAELRAHVAEGDTEAARWDTIRTVEDKYLNRYYELTGMTPEMLDWLLWEQAQHEQADITAELAPPTAPSVPSGAHAVNRHLGEAPPSTP